LRRERGGEEIGVVAPVGLEQDTVDLLEIDAFGLVAHGFEQTGQAQVAGPTQEAIGGADEEIKRVGGKGAMGQAAEVELGQDKRVDLLGVEPGEGNRIGGKYPTRTRSRVSCWAGRFRGIPEKLNDPYSVRWSGVVLIPFPFYNCRCVHSNAKHLSQLRQ
jgi:hypothetical protein